MTEREEDIQEIAEKLQGQGTSMELDHKILVNSQIGGQLVLPHCHIHHLHQQQAGCNEYSA